MVKPKQLTLDEMAKLAEKVPRWIQGRDSRASEYSGDVDDIHINFSITEGKKKNTFHDVFVYNLKTDTRLGYIRSTSEPGVTELYESIVAKYEAQESPKPQSSVDRARELLAR